MRRDLHLFADDTEIGQGCLMRDALLDALSTLPEEAKNEQTRHMEKVYRAIPSLPREVMPEESMLHEFLG